MYTGYETLRRLERLHVRAWPAAETERIDGWLWRWSGGGSQRANSVSTIDFIGNDVQAALDRVEARYRAKHSPAQLHTFDPGQPAELPRLLAARGYEAGETTLTMLATAAPPLAPLWRHSVKSGPIDTRVGHCPGERRPGDGQNEAEKPDLNARSTASGERRPASAIGDVTVTESPTPEWLGIYLEAITENRRSVNRQILRRIPDPRAFFSVRRGGRVISTALGVADGGHCVAECVATREDARGLRGAESAMRALMTWAASLGAHTVGLQVVAGNHPAMALYRRLGFDPVCTNRCWVRR